MAWYTGKSLITLISLGDSNIGGFGGSQPGVQTYNSANRFWASDGMGGALQWRQLDNDAASRYFEWLLLSSGQFEIYQGQLLGSNGAPAMQLADTIQIATGIPCYNCQIVKGGATSGDWITDLWSPVELALTTAFSAAPGAPTSADVIYLSIGGGDLIWSTQAMADRAPTDWHLPSEGVPADEVTAQEFYENVLEFRKRMIIAGWWIPGVTQIVINEIPRSGVAELSAYPAWQGLEYLLAGLNDRAALVSSVGRTYDPAWEVHFDPASMTEMGREAGEMLLAGLPQPEISGFWDELFSTGLALRTRGEIRGAISGGINMSGPLSSSQKLSGDVSAGSFTNGSVEVR